MAFGARAAHAASSITWHATRLAGSDALAVRASKKLKGDDLFITTLGSTVFRKYLDEIPLWRGETEVSQFVEDFARYLYLPRLAGPEVLIQAVCDGVELLTWISDSFAYAESHDETAGRYRGLRAGKWCHFPWIARDSWLSLIRRGNR